MSLSKKKEITDRIWTHSKTSGANKLMLLALTELADGDGFCWPSYETLGNMVGLTGNPDSIKRCALNNLAPLIEKNEVIVWKQQGKKGGRGNTNIYLIAVGLTDEEIREIVKRRLELQAGEVDSVLAKEGEEYTRLCTDRRVSSEALERTRDTKKGDTSIQATQPMGDKSITDKGNKGDTSIQDNPTESPKGDRLAPRSKESLTTTRDTAAQKLETIYLLGANGRSSQSGVDLVNDMLNTYPAEVIIYACAEAEKNTTPSDDKRNLKYIEAVCKRKVSGQPDKIPRKNGVDPSPPQTSSRGKSFPKDEDLYEQLKQEQEAALKGQ